MSNIEQLQALIETELMARCEKIRKKKKLYVSVSIDIDCHPSGYKDIDYKFYTPTFSQNFYTLPALIAHMDGIIKE